MTRFVSSRPCAWVEPRARSGRHDTHRLERDERFLERINCTAISKRFTIAAVAGAIIAFGVLHADRWFQLVNVGFG